MPDAAVTFDRGASGPADSGTLRGGALCAPPPPYPDYPRSHNRSRSGVGGPLTQATASPEPEAANGARQPASPVPVGV
eukprot:scaffold2037_cov149-Isochrysis_galbana.AAC.1